MRIIFLGTPEFAVATLHALFDAGFDVVAVVTAPDKPAGRGLKPHESAVKKYARERGLQILQPLKLKAPEFLNELNTLKADIQVVVAFRMLPVEVWDLPSKGTINLHASLLPLYRGAAPINWVIINGEKETGVTTFKLKHEIDTGDILLQEKIPISEKDTAGELHDKMKEVGAHLMVKTIHGIEVGNLKARPQLPIGNGQWAMGNRQSLPVAPKITKEMCRIDWNKPTEQIYNLIRGLSPYPGAFTILDGKILKLFETEKLPGSEFLQPGIYETDKKSYLKFSSDDGYINVKELQLEGKKKMKIQEFLKGYRFKEP